MAHGAIRSLSYAITDCVMHLPALFRLLHQAVQCFAVAFESLAAHADNFTLAIRGDVRSQLKVLHQRSPVRKHLLLTFCENDYVTDYNRLHTYDMLVNDLPAWTGFPNCIAFSRHSNICANRISRRPEVSARHLYARMSSLHALAKPFDTL